MRQIDLPNYVVSSIDESNGGINVCASTCTPVSWCPHCNGRDLVGFGRRHQKVKDLPVDGKPVTIDIDTRRFRCRQCGRTSYEQLPDVDDRRAMTTRLVNWIGPQAAKRAFTQIAEEVGVTETTIRAIFKDYLSNLEMRALGRAPKWMGIGDVDLIRPRCAVADIENGALLNILPDRSAAALSTYLLDLPMHESVEYVVMTVWDPYRNAVRDVMPQVRILVDQSELTNMIHEVVIVLWL